MPIRWSKRLTRIPVPALLAVLLFPVISCDSNGPTGPEPGNDDCPAGQWEADSYGYRTWRHDCAPYLSDHFTVYSDGSSTAAKDTLARLAEVVFSELAAEFLIAFESELGFTPGYTYYIYAQKHITPLVAEGYRHGFLIAAVDSPERPTQRNPSFYRYLMRHELTHVFQFSLINCPGNGEWPYWLDIWFSEGQAVVVGGRYTRPTLQQFRAWFSDPTHINPVRIQRRSDLPDVDRLAEYYQMFALTYAYLVDTAAGHGASMADVRNLLRYMREDETFHDAFQQALGISLSYLEENYMDIMEEYLG
ncbi:MAG: hypothetical protein JSW46_03135 [Gemmatimonadota bacterium]|nr:MAG: hypothetical protein JSW46_03135 [Gemmatimonadota bacterium]